VICPGGVGFETRSASGGRGAVLVANLTRPVIDGVSVRVIGTSLLSLRSAVQKLGFPASQIASQKLGADGQSLSLPVNDSAKPNSSETIGNKGGKSLSGAAWRVL